MIKIGITGNIGSGKSVVTALLSLRGIPIYSADYAGNRLSSTSPVIREKLIALFGDDIYVQNLLDRKKLASLAFSDDTILQKVNEIIHPVVENDFQTWLQGVKHTYCAIESAILIETGFDRLVDVTLMVFAPVEVRLRRVKQRDNMPEADILQRMSHQMPDELKRRHVDFVIINDDVQAVIPQVEAFIKSLSK